MVQFPTVVAEALAEFGQVFANEPKRRHFAECLTGLMVAQRKNVSAINREFAFTTDQSCLNRWLTEAEEDVEQLGRQRLAWLQKDPTTRSSPPGVIALDNVLVDHTGKLIEDVGYFWDHAERRYLLTIGQACWAVTRQTLSQTLSWALERLQLDGWKCEKIKAQLALP